MSAPAAWQRRDSSFMNEMRTASIVFDAYLMSSVERGVHHDEALAGALERRVELAQHSSAPRRRAPTTTRVGLEEVVDGVALLEELGVRDDLERVLRDGFDDLVNLVACSDGNMIGRGIFILI